ncbi:hypothetical protein BCR42DRAFT_426471 [Absidia repens]|uniref:Uncharacterized protein n=1 Tax=Absidia repens TaxID=90262 RepID=A0A1X2I1G1_9FUNG|nr:hypothetical protein BCR42DRAFT_426471 [Absidia repens]
MSPWYPTHYPLSGNDINESYEVWDGIEETQSRYHCPDHNIRPRPMWSNEAKQQP